MSEFTKGPWIVNKTGAHWNNPNLENIVITYGEIGECICDTVYEEANANLIAAAPEMYALLEIAHEYIDNCGAQAGAQDVLDQIESLLIKARGEL